MNDRIVVALIAALSSNLALLTGWVATWRRKRQLAEAKTRLEAATTALLPHVERLVADLNETDAEVIRELRRSAHRSRTVRRERRQANPPPRSGSRPSARAINPRRRP